MVNRKKLKLQRRHRIILLVSLIFIVISVFLLGLDKKNNAIAGWNADMRLNNSFREQNPSDGNIITALFGNGYPGSSPYNMYWEDFCLPNKITYVQNTTQLENMERDTIYIVKPDTYYTLSTIRPANCSAIVGMGTGETTFIGVNRNTFSITDKTHIILDNIIISGQNQNLNGINITNSNYNTLHNIEIFGQNEGIHTTNSAHNRFNSIKSHNNNIGIFIDNQFNFVSNSEIFNNNSGLALYNSENNILNNNQIYNNEIGIDIKEGQHNSINNCQIYNNSTGVLISSSTKNLINNSHIYSNNYGICVYGLQLNGENLLMGGNIYNNDYGFFGNGSIRYYDNIGLFGNNQDNNGMGFIIGGHEDESHYIQTDLLTLLRPSVGNFVKNLEMNQYLRTYPVDNNGLKFISQGSNYIRGKLNWTPQLPIKYIAGKEIIKQKNPLRFSIVDTGSWGMLLKEHNPKYFIASIDSERSELDDSIVNYYYGDYGETSEFTKNWNENNCNINVMNVKYISNQNEFYDNLLSINTPIGHTIYVLKDGLYNVTDTIVIENDCVAIVNYKGKGAQLDYYPGTNGQNSVIKINGQENIILDGLSINGRKNSVDNILFERDGEIASQNSTINNIQSFKSLGNGINLGMLSKYITVMNSQFWNNEKYGIEIFLAGEHNIVNNSLSYNNKAYGLRFGNKSKLNSINNSQFFNNGIGGIFSDLNTESNIINNVNSYNNTEYGINLKRSSGNLLNNISAYNNNIGINIEDDSAINNIYLSKIKLFSNTNGNLNGTNGNDTYLRPSIFIIPGLALDLDDNNDEEIISIEPVNLEEDDEDTEEENDTDSPEESLNSENRDIYKGILDILSGNFYNTWTNDYDCSNFTVVRDADFSAGELIRNLSGTNYETDCTNSGFTRKTENYCCDATGDTSTLNYNITPICSGHSTYTNNCELSGGTRNSEYFCCDSENEIENTFMCSEIQELIMGPNAENTAHHYTLENDIITLDNDTIFVLDNGNISIDYPIIMGKCNAILGGQDSTIDSTGGILNLFTFGPDSKYDVISHINLLAEDGSDKKIFNFENNDSPYTIIDTVFINNSLLKNTQNSFIARNSFTNTGYIKFLPTDSIPENNETPTDENTYGKIVYGGNISCMDVTIPQEKTNNKNLFFDNGCDKKGTIDERDPTMDTIPVNYIFGQNIKQQISPIGFIGNTMTVLNNQYISSSYIGETNPILYTDPGNIIFNGAYKNNIATGINYEIGIGFANKGLLNSNFDMILNITNPKDVQGHIELRYDGTRHDVGTTITNIDYKTLEDCRIIIKTPETYLQEIEGNLYIGTDEYGNRTENFRIQTIAEPIAPTINWIKNINNGGTWSDEDNIRQVKIDGLYSVSSRYDYVDSPEKCEKTDTMKAYKNLAQQNLKDLGSDVKNLNGKYICIYTKDNTNGMITTGVSKQIKISDINIADDVHPGPVYYDTINLGLYNVYDVKYTRVTNKSKCSDNNASNLNREKYDGNFVINSDLHNNKYLCISAKDGSGITKYFTSENKANIKGHGNIVNFSDGVNPSRNNKDTISVEFSGDIVFSAKKYKRVSNTLECSDTENMIDYSGDIIVDNSYLNGYYFCLYTQESGSNLENYLISPHPLKIDNTPPTTPTIIHPTNGESLYYLIIQLTGAYDKDSHIAGYEYQISKSSSFSEIFDEGYILSSGNVFAPKFNGTGGQYFIRIRAVDAAGNTSDKRSDLNNIAFTYVETSGYKLIDVTGADLGKNYQSNEITIEGLPTSGNLYIEVSTGTIYKNSVGEGTGTLVTNGDKISIRLKSSDKEYTKITANLIIANKIIERNITTKQGDPILKKYNITEKDKIAVETAFNSMKSMYKYDGDTLELFYTMQNMLKDEIALGENKNIGRLQYLLYLIENYIVDDDKEGGKIHTAPNCKKYEISYSKEKDAFYSPDMRLINGKISYFADTTSLLKFIDSKNIGGECDYHIYNSKKTYSNKSDTRYIAPNGKVYEISSTNLGYTSPDLITTKYFANLNDLKNYISKNNTAVSLAKRDHKVDSNYVPTEYTAPNGKKYVIYHTDKGYMSYKLMSVKYFETVEALQLYIKNNNPKK